MQVRDRDLGGRHQVQLVAGDDVHLVFLVGDLAGTACRVGVDDGRRPYLGEAVLGGVDVEEPRDQASLQARSRRPCRPGSPSRRSWRPAGCRGCRAPRRAPSGAFAPTLRPSGPAGFRHVRRGLAPRADGDVGLLATDRNVRVGRVRDPQQEVLELRLGRGELDVDPIDLLAGLGRGSAKIGHLRPVRAGTAADRLADPLRCAVALGLETVALGLEHPAPGVGSRGRGRRSPGPRPCRSRLAGYGRAPRGAAGRRRSSRRLPCRAGGRAAAR